MGLDEVIAKIDELNNSANFENLIDPDFFLEGSNFSALLKLSLSEDLCEIDNFKRYSKAATYKILANLRCLEIIQRIYDDPGFSRFLVRFLNSPACHNSFICTNYYHVFATFLKYSNGELLTTETDIIPSLIKHCDMMPLQSLLVAIVESFNRYVDDFDEFVSLLCQALRYKINFQDSAAVILKSLLTISNPDFEFPDFSELVETVFEQLTEKELPLYLQIKMLNLAELAIKMQPAHYSIANKYVDSFDFTVRNGLATHLFAIFKTKSVEQIEYIFSESQNPLISRALLTSIAAQPVSIIAKLVNEYNLVEKILKYADTLREHVFIASLARILKQFSTQVPELQSPEWNEFTNGPLATHVTELSSSYGGYTGTIVDLEDFQVNQSTDQLLAFLSTSTPFSFDSSDDE